MDFFLFNPDNPGVIGFTHEPPDGCPVERLKNVIYLSEDDVAPHWESGGAKDVCEYVNIKPKPSTYFNGLTVGMTVGLLFGVGTGLSLAP